MANTQKSRILFKSDTTANWKIQEDSFESLKGELYIYNDSLDTDQVNHLGEIIYRPKLKIGNGSSTLAQLPFLGNDPITKVDINNIFNQANNKVPRSIDANGNIYNGTGYKNGYRVRSQGGEGETNTGACTGFIPVKGGDVIRISGCEFNVSANENAINVSNSSFSNIGQFTMIGAHYDLFNQSAYSAYGFSSVVQESETVWKWIVPPASSGIAYIRISGYNQSGSNGATLIVTVNKPIVIEEKGVNSLNEAVLDELILG